LARWGSIVNRPVARAVKAISVVAQMAFNVVKTQDASVQQEEDDDHATVRK